MNPPDDVDGGCAVPARTTAHEPGRLVQYNDILDRLVRETVACTPAEWSHGTLTIDCDGMRINYKLKNPDQPGTASISETLRDLIDEFYVRMAEQGDRWTEAVISFTLDENSVKFDTRFTYC